MKNLKSVVAGLILAAGILIVPVLLVHAQTASAPAAPAPVVAKEVVNINTATVDQLKLLPGIGPKKAKAIVEHRTKMGDFKAIEDLKMIKGITDKVIAKLKDKAVLEGETTMKAAEKSAPKKKTVKKEAAPKAEAPAAPAPAPAAPKK
jgi:competence protein ComEA